MTDQSSEEHADALFRDLIRRKHQREKRGTLYVPPQTGRFKPLIVIERALRDSSTGWEVFTSTKNPKHAQNIVAEGENDAVYQYRIQPAIRPCTSSAPKESPVARSIRVPVSPDKH